ncbi:MAG: type II toxin-antitoxin system RelB/DinJ family antitoxin [Defluviitaleaceae bacterium]|nr:type II toxin-antitoxin system RelB/DinJ family antitoxin [Defluviitaleaceae bacterium]
MKHNQINVNIRMDKEIKEVAENLFAKMGLNMTSAINTFIRQAIREQALPFEVKPLDTYTLKVQKSIKELENGQKITFDFQELENLENMEQEDAILFLQNKQVD